MSLLLFAATLLALFAVFIRGTPSVRTWLVMAIVVFAVCMFAADGIGGWLSLIMLIGLIPAALIFFAPQLRKRHLSDNAFALVRKTAPQISPTEQAAIDAGGVWWDAELFRGAPDWRKLFDTPAPKLTAEERAFIDGPVTQLCNLADDWKITAECNDLPDEVWRFIRDNGFFGLNVARQYGGLEFSAYAQSCIIAKLASRSAAVAVTVMVPNSLGPAELLQHYGTPEQQQRHLPRLASGADTPCFALTSPRAGSDAAAMPDIGVVCEQDFDGQRTLGFRLTWQKRYITLAPVATIIGLAFRAHDPDHLLGAQDDLGITCALIPATHPGVEIGMRHQPLNAAFQNGPTRGRDVFIPLDWIIGGREQIGRGWTMLMESLAAGRGISLPAAACGAAMLAARTGGAYSRVREQFGLPIGKFEGVQESLARIGGLTYLLDAARTLMTDALGAGERPSVMSAIVKQQCTELSRTVINDAMDIHGGKAICLGRGNYLARTYQQLPIGITVEGANILTRSLIIFGQGAMRCHPFLLDELVACTRNDADARAAFDELLVNHIDHIAANKLRATALSLTRGKLARGVGRGLCRKHSRTIEQLSAAFAFLADVTLLTLGGEFKRREMLSARFADVLSNLLLASAVLKKFTDRDEPDDEKPLVDWACKYALFAAQQSLDAILRNYPRKWLGMLLRVNVFAGGRYLQPPSDSLNRQVAELLQRPGKARDRLTEWMHRPDDSTDVVAQLETALVLSEQTDAVRRRLREQDAEPGIAQSYQDWLHGLQVNDVITREEFDLLAQLQTIVEQIIAVDEFAADAFDLRGATHVDSQSAARVDSHSAPSTQSAQETAATKMHVDMRDTAL